MDACVCVCDFFSRESEHVLLFSVRITCVYCGHEFFHAELTYSCVRIETRCNPPYHYIIVHFGVVGSTHYIDAVRTIVLLKGGHARALVQNVGVVHESVVADGEECVRNFRLMQVGVQVVLLET